MEDKAKLVTPEVEVKDADVRINVGNEGENGAVELDAVRTNKGRAAAQNTYGVFFWQRNFPNLGLGFIGRGMLAKQLVH